LIDEKLTADASTLIPVIMVLLGLLYALLGTGLLANGISEDEYKARAKGGSNQEVLGYGIDGERYKTACPDYKHYAVVPQ